MRKLLAILVLILPLAAFAQSVATIHGECAIGNTKTILQGMFSSTLMRVSYPQCLVTVYDHGGGLATLYSDDVLTHLSNPFTATTNGHFVFYATVGQRYDVTLSGGLGANNVGGIGFPTPYTIADIYLLAGGGGGSCAVPNYLLNGVFVGAEPAWNVITTHGTLVDNPTNNRVDYTPFSPYDVVFALPGVIGATGTANSTIIPVETFTRTVTFPANFGATPDGASSKGSCGANPTAGKTFTVLENGFSVGTAAISTSCVFTFTSSGGLPVTFTPGDRMTLQVPTSDDATLADVAITWAGTWQ
jgi:hypothetical protein